jgi:hypothetical protein
MAKSDSTKESIVLDAVDPRERSDAPAEDEASEISPSRPLLVSVWNCYDILGVPPNVFRTWARRGCFRVFEDNHGRWLVAAYDEVKAFLDHNFRVRASLRKTSAKDDEAEIVREFEARRR